jgi:hypothetical protein
MHGGSFGTPNLYGGYPPGRGAAGQNFDGGGGLKGRRMTMPRVALTWPTTTILGVTLGVIDKPKSTYLLLNRWISSS